MSFNFDYDLDFQEYRPDWRRLVRHLAYAITPPIEMAWRQILLPEHFKQLAAWDEQLPGASELAVELFARLYDKPDAIPVEDVAPEAVWAVRIHQCLDSHGFVDYCQETQGSTAVAYQVAISTMGLIMLHLPCAPVNETRTAEEVLGELKTEEAAIKMAIDKAPDANLKEQLEYDLGVVQDRIKALERMGIKGTGVSKEYAEALAESILTRYQEAIENAVQNIDPLLRAMGGMGFPYSGVKKSSYSTLSIEPNPKARFEFAKQLKRNPKFADIAALIGQIRQAAAGIRSKAKGRQVSEEIAGVWFGNDLSSLNESEFTRLADPDLEKQFDRDFEEQRLTLDESTGELPKDAGSMAILVDTSDSMGMKEKGELDRLSIAMAMAIALLNIAADEKRPAWLALFDQRVRSEKSWNAGDIDQHELIKLAEKRHEKGGTDFVEPLEKAMANIESGAIAEDSHILMITDGQDYLDEEWRISFKERMEASGTKLHVLLIGGGSNHPFDFAERVIMVDALTDKASTQIFAF